MDTLPLVMPADAAPGFDYSSLPAEMVSRRQEQAGRIRGMYRQTVETAGEIGRELLAAQEEMEHGQFLPWVTGAVGLSKSTAYRCMDMARAFGSKLPTVGSLPLAVVHKLAEKSTPEPVRAAVLRRIEAGEAVRATVILDEVREAQDLVKKQAAAEREKARVARLTPEQREHEELLRSRGKKRQEAFARKAERDRAQIIEERRANEAEAQVGAAYLLKQLGADEIAVFFARFDHAARYRIFDRVVHLAHAERARDIEPVDLKLDRVSGSSSYEFIDPEAQKHARDLAQRFEAGEPVEPVVVVNVGTSTVPRYQIVEGEDRYHALRGVLGRETIPSRIAPPADPAAVASFNSDNG